MRESYTAVCRTGHSEHWTNLLFQPIRKPGLSLFSSYVFKYVFSYVLCFCVPGDVAWCCCALLHPRQSWTGCWDPEPTVTKHQVRAMHWFCCSERFSLSVQIWAEEAQGHRLLLDLPLQFWLLCSCSPPSLW